MTEKTQVVDARKIGHLRSLPAAGAGRPTARSGPSLAATRKLVATGHAEEVGGGFRRLVDADLVRVGISASRRLALTHDARTLLTPDLPGAEPSGEAESACTVLAFRRQP